MSAPRLDRRLRVGFLYLHPWGHEFRDVASGATPTHRLFGAAELAAAGHDVRFCAQGGRLPWRLHQAGWALATAHRLDVLVATHEAAAQVCLVLRAVRLLRRPLLVMTVAATDDSRHSAARRRLDAWLLRRADRVTVFARSQLPDALALGLAPERVSFLAFGVDTAYFAPRDAPQAAAAGRVLSVGTNEGKDYATLVRALPPDWAATIVTDQTNVALARAAAGDKDVEYLGDLPIGRLRELYADAPVIAIPLRESRIASGQTVLLEALAMDRRVVVSDVPAIRDYLGDGATRAVPAGDVAALSAALLAEAQAVGQGTDGGTDAVATPSPREHLVRNRFTATDFGQRLESALLELLDSRNSGRHALPGLESNQRR